MTQIWTKRPLLFFDLGSALCFSRLLPFSGSSGTKARRDKPRNIFIRDPLARFTALLQAHKLSLRKLTADRGLGRI